jgi:hypothetical protein
LRQPMDSARSRILFSDKGSDRFDAMRPENYPLEGLILAEKPLLTEADLDSYNRTRHVMHLKPGARERLPKPSVWGVPFAVVVDGKPLFLGAFWTGASSYSANMPTISLDRWHSKLPDTDPDHLPPNSIRIENSRVLRGGDLPNDPRRDERFYRALEQAGKLLDIRSAEEPWGDPVQGIAARLRTERRPQWSEDYATPWVLFDLRNDSKDLEVTLNVGGAPSEVLVDGVLYQRHERVAGQLPICNPGQRVVGATLILDKHWTAVKTVSGTPDLHLKPGKHKIQAIVNAHRSGEDADRVRVLSSTVEIEIKPAETLPREEASVEKAGLKFEAGFIAEKTEIMAGEAIYVTFYVRNTGTEPIYLETGGDGRSIRSYRFQFSATDEQGGPARDPHPNPGHFGGLQGPPPAIKPGETYSEKLQLSKWLTFDRPGQYTVRGARTLQFPKIQDFTPDYALVHPLATSFRLTVLPQTDQGLSARIEALGKRLRAEEDEKNARLTAQLLTDSGDERVIPHLLWAANKWSGDSWALYNLSTFKDDPRGIAPYREALTTSRGNSRRSNAARLMGESGNKDFHPDLLQAFAKEEDKFVLTSVATALGQFGDTQAISILKQHRDHTYPHLRLQVEQALVQCGEPLDVERFQAIIRTTGPTWHSAAHFVSVNGGDAAVRIIGECLDFDHPEADVGKSNHSVNSAYRNGRLLMYIAQAGGPQFDYNQIRNRPATADETETNRQTLRKVRQWLRE